MARVPRVNFSDAVYHVSSGNGRARIVYNDDDRERFERQLRDNVQTYGILLYAWVLMDNYFSNARQPPRHWRSELYRGNRAAAARWTLDRADWLPPHRQLLPFRPFAVP